MSESPMDQIRRWQREINSLPPTPQRIIARHDVPYGRTFRQWDTLGRLVVYINRGVLPDVPGFFDPPLERHAWRPDDPLGPILGIPIVFE